MTRRLCHKARHVIKFPGEILNPLTGDLMKQITLSDKRFFELSERAKKEGMNVKEYMAAQLACNRFPFPTARLDATLSLLIYKLRKKTK